MPSQAVARRNNIQRSTGTSMATRSRPQTIQGKVISRIGYPGALEYLSGARPSAGAYAARTAYGRQGSGYPRAYRV